MLKNRSLKRSRFFAFLVLVLIGSVLWLKGVVFLDPDFGFRLRTGGLILGQEFPKTDPYSYTMPSYPYVEHARITGIAWAYLYPVIGKIGLAAIYSGLALLALIISSSRAKTEDNLSSFAIFPFLLAGATLLPFVGVRAQVVTWVFLAVLLKVILDGRSWRRWRFVLPLYFVLWVNLHGGFAAGLATLALVIVLRAVRQKRIEAADVGVLFASFFATLVNPYMVGVWREVWSSVSDPLLRFTIAEWMPALFMFDFAFPAFFTLSALFIIRHRDKFALEEIGLYFAFLLSSLLSRRHIPLWVVVGLPMTISGIKFFYQEISGDKVAVSRFRKVMELALVFGLALFVLQAAFSLKDAWALSENSFYPSKAVSFVRSNPTDGQIFSRYGWGGYLIWKLPEKKVFIDGRMPSWRWDPKTEGELASAFDTYNDLLRGDVEYIGVFEDFGVDTVLWPVPRPPGNFLARLGGKRQEFNFLEQLVGDGWEKVYGDSVAVVYKKPE